MNTKLNAIIALILFGFAIFCGCARTPETATKQAQNAKPAATPDDAAIVDAIEAIGAKLKRDGNGNITTVDFRGTEVGDDDLKSLAGLKKLSSLQLNDTAITDAALAHVGTLTTLTNLDLRGCEVTDDGIPSLSGLTNLKALRFSGKTGKTDVTDDSMHVIANFPKLKVLALDFLKFAASAEGLSELSNLKEMQELYIGNTLVNDESLKVIAESFPKLKKLRAAASQVADEGLVQIAKMSNLEEVDLSENVQIYDSSLEHIAGMKQLKKLNLWKVPIADDGVEYLAGLTNLEWLNLDQTGLGDDGLAYLSGMAKLTFLHLGSTGITNDGLEHLKSLTSLKDLKVTRTDVNEEGVAELKKSLTNTDIQLKYVAGQ